MFHVSLLPSPRGRVLALVSGCELELGDPKGSKRRLGVGDSRLLPQASLELTVLPKTGPKMATILLP